MGVTFRDESNEPSSTIIGYSDATVTVPNNPLIMRSKALLATTHATYHNCGCCFVIRLHLIPLISGQSGKKNSPLTKQGLESPESYSAMQETRYH